MLIDTHTHLDAFARGGSLPAVLERAKAAGVAELIAIGTEPDDWALYRDLSKQLAGVIHYAVGIHPCHVAEGWEDWMKALPTFWDEGKRPVALGECGLDRYHLPTDGVEAQEVFGRQKAAFAAQLKLAKELGCPVVVHSRQAFRECVELISASGVEWSKVVFHCFAEGAAEMEELNRLGGVGSFTGILTYKNADAVREAARAQGIERFMLETDAPYLAPAPHRGKGNEPAYLKFTAEAASDVFQVSVDRLEEQATANSRRFFGI